MFATLALFFGLTAAATPSLPQGGQEVDVELVLAVDMSGSMDLEEARIQRSGYIEALRHPDFITAVSGGLTGRIAISYFEWAGSVNETSLVDWQMIETSAEAAAFADKLDARTVVTRRGTSISNALGFAAALIDRNGYAGLRRVIDVSGDGPNNSGPPVVPARDATLTAGVIVNGLAIMIRPSGGGARLDRYYADCVIGGPGSFVLPVHRPEDFVTAIRQKLILEVSERNPSGYVVPVKDGPASDCLIGEKLRPGLFDR